MPIIKPCQGHKIPEKVWTERPEELSTAQVAWDLLSEDGSLATMKLGSKFEGVCKDGHIPDAVSVEYAQGNYRHFAGLINLNETLCNEVALSDANSYFKVRIENADFWGSEADGEDRVDDVFGSLFDVVVAANEFLRDSGDAGMDYDEEQIEVVAFKNGNEVDVITLADAIAKDYEAALAIAKDDYELVDTNVSKTFTGKVEGITELYVVQSLGRSSAIHEKCILDSIPVVEKVSAISYDGLGHGNVSACVQDKSMWR